MDRRQMTSGLAALLGFGALPMTAVAARGNEYSHGELPGLWEFMREMYMIHPDRDYIRSMVVANYGEFPLHFRTQHPGYDAHVVIHDLLHVRPPTVSRPVLEDGISLRHASTHVDYRDPIPYRYRSIYEPWRHVDYQVLRPLRYPRRNREEP